MLRHERGLEIALHTQKPLKLLGEDVIWTHSERWLVSVIGIFGQRAEDTYGDGGQFVLVVEHHPAVASDSKVFQQEISGKDASSGKFLDGVAVIDDRRC